MFSLTEEFAEEDSDEYTATSVRANAFEISISCDAEATYDPDDVHVHAVSRTYEACLTESPASQLTCTTPSATPLEGDEKLPNVTGLQMLSVQELSLEPDARDDVFPGHIYIEQSHIVTRIQRDARRAS